MGTETSLEDVARIALEGDREALERLVRALEGDVYGLALRMLWNPEDAEDATQEILVRVVTRLSQLDFRSRLLKTWVHRSSHPRASSIDFAHRLADAFDRSRASAG